MAQFSFFKSKIFKGDFKRKNFRMRFSLKVLKGTYVSSDSLFFFLFLSLI